MNDAWLPIPRFWGACGILLLTAGFGVPGALAAPDEEAPEADSVASTKKGGAPENPLDQLPWVKEGQGLLGDRAELAIPEGFRFAESQTAVTVLRAMGNIPSGDELALVGPDNLEWFVIYEFSDIGYVKDDEKDDLDADDMLQTFREGAKSENDQRSEAGLATVEILDWAIPPRYDEANNVLEWATKLRFTEPSGESNLSVNYKTKVLGRKGVMDVVVVCAPDELEEVLPAYRGLMEGFSFSEGERYSEFKAGDKIAEYGLAALVVGAGTAVAAKAGLFAVILGFFKKGAKLIVVAVAAIGAFLARMFRGKKA